MTVVCRPFRIEETERDLLFRVKHGRRLTVLRFVAGVAVVSLAAAVLLHLMLGGLLVDIAPSASGPQTTIPVIGWAITVGAGLFFARRMDAASAVVTPMPEQTVTISSDGVRVETTVSVTDWRWSAWVRFHDRPEALMLEEPGGAMVILPARAFPDVAARDAARAMVAARLPAAGGGAG
ncbi:MAG: hypothetical protein OEL76_15785 [Siculibacillus sp.]|nr:hypothetical protein [Siculibacillus sp.]